MKEPEAFIRSEVTQRRVAQVLLVPNFAVLFWLVWTPNPSSNCGAEALKATEIFCLPTFWGLVGNFMLLMPTALLLYLVFGNNQVSRIAFFLVVLPTFIEVAQNFIPGRDPDFLDFVVNAFGGIAALFFFAWAKPVSNQNEARK